MPAHRTVFDPADPDVNPYRLLTGLVVPRPIAWVSTLDAEGRGNLAPHSFFTVASGRPPVILFSSLGRKDTVRNIEETGEFVVSFSSEALLEQVNNSSAPFEHGDDEAARARHRDRAVRDRRPAAGGRVAGLDRVPAAPDRRGRARVRGLRAGHRDHGASTTCSWTACRPSTCSARSPVSAVPSGVARRRCSDLDRPMSVDDVR